MGVGIFVGIGATVGCGDGDVGEGAGLVGVVGLEIGAAIVADGSGFDVGASVGEVWVVGLADTGTVVAVGVGSVEVGGGATEGVGVNPGAGIVIGLHPRTANPNIAKITSRFILILP